MGKKNENFQRIGDKRLDKTLLLIDQMSNLSNSSYYEYTEADIDNIFKPIEDKLRLTKEKLLSSTALKEEITYCSFKNILKCYKNDYREYGDESIVNSLTDVFRTVNWRVQQNKTMQNTYELIEFAFAYCDGLNDEEHYAYYIYSRLNAFEDLLNYEYKNIKDNSNLMNRVEKE